MTNSFKTPLPNPNQQTTFTRTLIGDVAQSFGSDIVVPRKQRELNIINQQNQITKGYYENQPQNFQGVSTSIGTYYEQINPNAKTINTPNVVVKRQFLGDLADFEIGVTNVVNRNVKPGVLNQLSLFQNTIQYDQAGNKITVGEQLTKASLNKRTTQYLNTPTYTETPLTYTVAGLSLVNLASNIRNFGLKNTLQGLQPIQMNNVFTPNLNKGFLSSKAKTNIYPNDEGYFSITTNKFGETYQGLTTKSFLIQSQQSKLTDTGILTSSIQAITYPTTTYTPTSSGAKFTTVYNTIPSRALTFAPYNQVKDATRIEGIGIKETLSKNYGYSFSSNNNKIVSEPTTGYGYTIGNDKTYAYNVGQVKTNKVTLYDLENINAYTLTKYYSPTMSGVARVVIPDTSTKTIITKTNTNTNTKLNTNTILQSITPQVSMQTSKTVSTFKTPNIPIVSIQQSQQTKQIQTPVVVPFQQLKTESWNKRVTPPVGGSNVLISDLHTNRITTSFKSGSALQTQTQQQQITNLINSIPNITPSINIKPPKLIPNNFFTFEAPGGMFDLGMSTRMFKGSQKKKYTPDFGSLVFKKFGQAPKRITGLESRPITKGFTWTYNKPKKLRLRI